MRDKMYIPITNGISAVLMSVEIGNMKQKILQTSVLDSSFLFGEAAEKIQWGGGSLNPAAFVRRIFIKTLHK